MSWSRSSGSSAAVVVAIAALGASAAGMLAGIEPFATWFYPLAWYPTLLLLDAAAASREGRFFLFGRPAFLLSALAWSVPFWLVFELLNLRLGNWYYVFLPRDPVARWSGIALSFATVVPAVLVAERALAAFGFARRARSPRLRLGSRLGWILQGLGALMLALALSWPRALFPLVWGGVFLLVDPWVGRREPDRSLLGDLERGRPGRTLRLLAGGLAIGLLWEVFNLHAGGKWIYTVPGLEDLKLFEMPILGFLGFPFFALEAFAAWQALVVAGLAVPDAGRPRPGPLPARVLAGLAGLAFAALTIGAMHRGTISSVVPSLADLAVPAAALSRAGIADAWALAEAEPERVAAAARVDVETARPWIERARLATLRGIGAPRARALEAVGVRSVEDLAQADPARLVESLRAAKMPVEPARVRVWVRAAREAAREAARGG